MALAISSTAMLVLAVNVIPICCLGYDVAKTPPMGWNSWASFGVAISEDVFLGTAAALKLTGLADAGYVFVNTDDGWMMDAIP